MEEMEAYKLRAVSDDLKVYDVLAKDGDFIEVSQWNNGEGYTISINEDTYNFTIGQLDAINYLVKTIEVNESRERMEKLEVNDRCKE